METEGRLNKRRYNIALLPLRLAMFGFLAFGAMMVVFDGTMTPRTNSPRPSVGSVWCVVTLQTSLLFCLVLLGPELVGATYRVVAHRRRENDKLFILVALPVMAILGVAYVVLLEKVTYQLR